MKLQTVFLSCILAILSLSIAEILQNPDFEIPPSNWNSTSDALDGNSTIAGWSFSGAVKYVTAGTNFSLPGKNGHAILLGLDGKINQTFVTENGEEKQYVLTLTLARGVRNCSANGSVVVSAPDSSAQFALTLKYGENPWEVYGHQIGKWSGGESVNLVVESQADGADPNATCWMLIDDLQLTTLGSPQPENENLLQNGGFESGPAFPELSDGVLLDSEPSLVESALQQWTVMGTIKYISAKNSFVPKGKAAIEIVSGVSGGVQTVTQLKQGSNYNLEFMLGDANDSCTGDFNVGVIAGSSAQNFTVQSSGTGSAKEYSITFKGVGPSPTPISFLSYTTKQREDGVFCGPVIDAVALRISGGHRLSMHSAFVIALMLVALMRIAEIV